MEEIKNKRGGGSGISTAPSSRKLDRTLPLAEGRLRNSYNKTHLLEVGAAVVGPEADTVEEVEACRAEGHMPPVALDRKPL